MKITMTTLIEIMSSVSQEEDALTTVEAFCKQAGGMLMGRLLK
jgi:hypothetical protein